MKRWNLVDCVLLTEFQFHTDPMDQLDKGKIQVRFLKEKMAGHMGDKLRTILNLEVVKSDLENNLLYLKGSIPGSKNTTVLLRESVKNVNRKTIKEKHDKNYGSSS